MGVAEIIDLMAETAELADSARNRELLALAERVTGQPGAGPRRPGETQFAAFLGPSVWGRKLGFSLVDYYTDPDTCLEWSLRINLIRFKEIRDDTPLSKTLGFSLGAGFDPCLFGGRQVYVVDEDPWVDRDHVISSVADLERMPMPDFYTSGMMPLAHRFYARYRELADLAGGGFDVAFPELGRGPFGLAWHLRGHSALLFDLFDDPDFALTLLRFVTEARKHYERQRADFLGQPIAPGSLMNDEVNVPALSPGLYREFVLPLELDLAAFHGGIRYWHCCGNIVPLLPLIQQLRPRVQQLSPYNDFEAAVAGAGDSSLQIWMHPSDEVVLASEEEMYQALRWKLGVCEAQGVRSYTITTGHTQVMRSPDHSIEQVKAWVWAARRASEEVSAAGG